MSRQHTVFRVTMIRKCCYSVLVKRELGYESILKSSQTRIYIVSHNAETILKAHGELCKAFSRNSLVFRPHYVAQSTWLRAGRLNSRSSKDLQFTLYVVKTLFSITTCKAQMQRNAFCDCSCNSLRLRTARRSKCSYGRSHSDAGSASPNIFWTTLVQQCTSHASI